jgi:Phospholipase_D-nuclease N-terminal
MSIAQWEVQVNVPSGQVVLALLPLVVLILGLVVYCLVDLVRARSVRYLPKPVWALLIVLGSAPFGALAYLVFGRNHDANPVPDADPAATAEEHITMR